MDYVALEEIYNAVRTYTAIGVRKLKNGKFEAYFTTNYLGTYDKKEDAENKVIAFKVSSLLNKIRQEGYNIENGILFKKKYIVFLDGTIFNLFGKKLTPFLGGEGYLEIALSVDGTRKYFLVHRVIAECFIPNPFNFPEINHINGKKTDNRISNLEWCDRSYNMKHAYREGLATKIGKIPCLTKQEKDYIKTHYKDSINKIATVLHRNPTTVWLYLKKYREEFTPNKKYIAPPLTIEEKEYILKHRYSSVSDIAMFLNRGKTTIRRYLKKIQ